MDEDTYVALKRGLSIVVALITFSLGAYFSYDGFGQIAPDGKIIGAAFVIIITGTELVWNGEGFKHSIGITIAAMICYGYGIITNFIGFLWFLGEPVIENAPMAKILVGSFVAPMLEVLPEAFLVYGLLGKAHMGDLLHSLVGTKGAGRGPMPATATHQATTTQARTLGGK